METLAELPLIGGQVLCLSHVELQTTVGRETSLANRLVDDGPQPLAVTADIAREFAGSGGWHKARRLVGVGEAGLLSVQKGWPLGSSSVAGTISQPNRA